jgi:hypothetical protein
MEDSKNRQIFQQRKKEIRHLTIFRQTKRADEPYCCAKLCENHK